MYENKTNAITPLSILVQQLKDIVKMAEEEKASPSVVGSLQKAYTLAAGLDPYLNRNTTPESPALAALALKTTTENWSKFFSKGEEPEFNFKSEMLSGHVVGQALKMFVYMTGAKRILEIGMFTGYSALAMAEALPDDGIVVACEIDKHVSQFARDCFKESVQGSKITVKVAPAMKTLRQLADDQESFDFVFIDANKQEYIDYLEILLDTSLLAPNGFICVDNTLFEGEAYLKERTANGEAIARFNQVVAEDVRCEQVLLPVRDGLTIIRRK